MCVSHVVKYQKYNFISIIFHFRNMFGGDILDGGVTMSTSLFCFVCHRESDANDDESTSVNLFNSQASLLDILFTDM